ncbi:hypothetical protein Lal_00020349 [Lupinus albus]|nr:hypothetical protein Lal_00020349 [Lupinus albus]
MRRYAYSGDTDEMVRASDVAGSSRRRRAEDTIEVLDLTSDSDDEVVAPVEAQERSPWLTRMKPRRI